MSLLATITLGAEFRSYLKSHPKCEMRTISARMSHSPTVVGLTNLRPEITSVEVTSLGSQSLREPLSARLHVCKRIGFGLPWMAVVAPNPPPVNEMVGPQLQEGLPKCLVA